MESRYIIIVFMGIGMIFLSFFGIPGGLFAFGPGVTYNLREDFVDLNRWMHISTAQIVAPEIMRLTTSTGTEATITYIMTSANLPGTFEVKFMLSSDTALTYRLLVVHSNRICALAISNNAIVVYSSETGATRQVSKTHVFNIFYTYRVTMNDVGQYTVYEGVNELVSGVMFTAILQPGFMVYMGVSGDAGSSVDVDYFYDVKGMQSPVYTVSVDAYCNTEGKAVVAQVQADGTSQKNTPCTYEFALGTSHQIAIVGSNDVHPFFNWDSRIDGALWLLVNDAGSHIAHFQQSSPTTYTVDVSGFCDTEATSVSVAVVSDGILKQTPCSFTYNLGTTHTITASSQDGSAHPFLGWDSSTSGNVNLQVTDSGSHVAHYKQGAVQTGTLILTTFVYNGTDWTAQGNVQATAYIKNDGGWDFVKSVTTASSGSTVGEDTKFGVGIYKFEATWQGITNNTIDENQAAIGGEYWVTNLYLGHGPLNQPNPPDLITQILNAIRGFLASDIGKGFMMYGGIGVTAIGSVLFVYPKAPKLLGFHGHRR